jgi:hypothetical protein
MAYTYDDFTKAATSAGLMDSFDSNDLSMAQKYPEYGLSLVTLKRDLGNAKTNEQQLLVNEAINQLRKNYGSYWTGDPGSRTYATSYGSKIGDLQKKIDNYGDFKYDKEDDYKGLLDRIVNQKEFSYDYETDPLFSAFKKQYNREGDRAVANAIAQAAAATGGRTSSWSDTVAQQQANYYAAMLADKIPELRAQRLDEYNNEFNNLLQSFSSLGADRSTKLTEFNNGLDILRKNLSGYQQQDESDYKRFLDALNAEYQRDRDAVTDAQQEFDNALKIYQLTGQVTGVLADYLGNSAVADAGSGGGGGGGGYGSYKGSTSMTSAPETTSTNKALVTVPAYDAKGNLTTRLVTQGAAKTAMNTYLDQAKQRNDINQETYVAMKQEVAKPGSTGGMADVLAIQSDQQRGLISSEEAAKRYANVAKTTGNQYAQKLATDAQQKAEAEAAARQALLNQLNETPSSSGAVSAGAAKASGTGSKGSSDIGKSASSGSSSSSGGGTFLGGAGNLPKVSTGTSGAVAAGVKAASNAGKSSGSGLAVKKNR